MSAYLRGVVCLRGASATAYTQLKALLRIEIRPEKRRAINGPAGIPDLDDSSTSLDEAISWNVSQ